MFLLLLESKNLILSIQEGLIELKRKFLQQRKNLYTWHSMRVPPDWTKSSTITTCLPRGSPSLMHTILWSPSRTLLQTICTCMVWQIKQKPKFIIIASCYAVEQCKECKYIYKWRIDQFLNTLKADNWRNHIHMRRVSNKLGTKITKKGSSKI